MELETTFRTVGKQVTDDRISAEYHQYAELKHTWRSKNRNIVFRISDYMVDAPDEVTEALAWYLICKATESPCPDGMSVRYHEYARSPEMWRPKRDIYIARARNLSFRPIGNHRDLGQVFDYVNGCYFDGELRRPDLAWTKESPSHRLGFYFKALNLLAANRIMDSEKVPRYVLEFVVYHELLHEVMVPKGTPSRNIHHTKEFKDREKQFSMYSEAESWLSRLARPKNRRR